MLKKFMFLFALCLGGISVAHAEIIVIYPYHVCKAPAEAPEAYAYLSLDNKAAWTLTVVNKDASKTVTEVNENSAGWGPWGRHGWYGGFSASLLPSGTVKLSTHFTPTIESSVTTTKFSPCQSFGKYDLEKFEAWVLNPGT